MTIYSSKYYETLLLNDPLEVSNVLENIESICRASLTPIALSKSKVIEIANASRSRIIRKENKILTILSETYVHPFHFIINKN